MSDYNKYVEAVNKIYELTEEEIKYLRFMQKVSNNFERRTDLED